MKKNNNVVRHEDKPIIENTKNNLNRIPSAMN